VLEDLRPELVVHLAAAPLTAPPGCQRAVTLQGTRTLIAALRRAAPGAQLIGVGSAAELGSLPPDHALVGDLHPCRPATAYGQAKHAASRLILRYRSQGARASVLRLFTAVSDEAPGHSLIGSLVRQMRALPAGGGLVHVQDPNGVRDYLDADQVASWLVELARRGAELPPLMNLCSGHPVTVGAWVEALAAARAVPVRVAQWGQPVRPGDPQRVVGDPATLRRLGFSPQPIALRHLAARIIAPWPG
jgi:nucleoside-diphosphate-sugar epimerase